MRGLETLHALGALDDDARCFSQPSALSLVCCILAADTCPQQGREWQAASWCSQAILCDAAVLPERAAQKQTSLTSWPCMCRLTQPRGVQLAELPLPPSLGAALLAAAETGCAREVAAVAALLSVRSVWITQRGQEALLDEEKAKCASLSLLGSQSRTVMDLLLSSAASRWSSARCGAARAATDTALTAQGACVIACVCRYAVHVTSWIA